MGVTPTTPGHHNNPHPQDPAEIELPGRMLSSLNRVAEALAARDQRSNGEGTMEFTRPVTMLGIWAHPDDESYLSATLMARVRRTGGRVVVVTATSGEAGLAHLRRDGSTVREAELRAALDAVGGAELHLLGLPDGRCREVDHDRAVQTIESIMRELEPDLVVTFGPDGITGHPDHESVSRWTLDAWQRVGHGRVLLATMTDDFVSANRELHDRIGLSMGPPLHSVPSHSLSLRITPTAAERELKRAALDAHQSQTRPLADVIGYQGLHDWWIDETFRDPCRADLQCALRQPASIP